MPLTSKLEYIPASQNPHERWLLMVAEEIAKAGHNGWGNTCIQAADEIARLEKRVFELGRSQANPWRSQMRYRKKPVVIDAILWEGGAYKCLEDFCGHNWGRADAKDVTGPVDGEGVVVWNTKEKQWLHMPVGHWLIRGIGGELYPCDPEIFSATYTPTSGTAK